MDARRYAGVALRATWAGLLGKLRLYSRANAAYDEALVRAAALATEFEPPINVWSTPTTQGTAPRMGGTFYMPWKI